MAILLFDIDGTLIRCGGAGESALKAAFTEEFNVADVGDIELHGRTDLGILNELLLRHGLTACEKNRHCLSQRYFALLPQYMAERLSELKAVVLPGVIPLLEQLTRDARHTVALMTGNFPTSARIKLDSFCLWDYFAFGIFGDLADHRPNLAQPALGRIAQHLTTAEATVSGGSNCPDKANLNSTIVVVGDTPLDVQLAHAMGARCLAVCTGGFDKRELIASGASLVLDDLSDTETILRWFESAAWIRS